MNTNIKEKFAGLKHKLSELVHKHPAEDDDAPPSFKLLVIVVEQGLEEEVNEFLSACEAELRMNFFGKGTAPNDLMNILGLGDPNKDVVSTIVETEKIPLILDALSTKLHADGIAFTVRLSSIGGKKAIKLIKNEH